MTRIALAVLVKIAVKMHKFTRIPMTRLKVSPWLLNFSRVCVFIYIYILRCIYTSQCIYFYNSCILLYIYVYFVYIVHIKGNLLRIYLCTSIEIPVKYSKVSNKYRNSEREKVFIWNWKIKTFWKILHFLYLNFFKLHLIFFFSFI